MLPVTKKWLFLKFSSLILLPLMLWFILSLVNFYDKSYQEIVGFLTSQPSKFLMGLFLVFIYFFSALSISEVFEDYIKDTKICLLYTSPSPRDATLSRMPSSA